MALSEQERRLLEQLEASLKAEDPTFAETLSGKEQIRIHRKRAALAGLGFVLGLVALLGGIHIHPLVSITGFACMAFAALVGIGAWQRVSDESSPATDSNRGGGSRPSSGAKVRHSSQDFMAKLEERWRKRQQGDL